MTIASKAVAATLLLGAIAASLSIGSDYVHKREVAASKKAYAAGVIAATETAKRNEKPMADKACMAFWFGGDTQRVAKAIQKLKAS